MNPSIRCVEPGSRLSRSKSTDAETAAANLASLEELKADLRTQHLLIQTQECIFYFPPPPPFPRIWKWVLGLDRSPEYEASKDSTPGVGGIFRVLVIHIVSGE